VRLCDEDMVAAFLKVSTPNQWESKRHVWFDFLDGTAPEAATDMKPLFTIYGHHKDGRTTVFTPILSIPFQVLC